MKRGIVLAWLFGLAAVHAMAEDSAVDLAYKTRYAGEARGLRNDSVFAPGIALASFGRDRGRFEGEARGRAGPVSLLLTGTVSGQQGQRTLSKLLANEAYVDFGSGENRFTAGKKLLSGDAGYGFRPIDVLQRELRLQALPPALEGIPSLIWERFTADAAWSLAWTNPGYGRRSDPRDDGSLALRGYLRAKAADLHGVARVSSRYGSELGAALSAVPRESLELHASFLVQRRGERLAPLADPASIARLLSPDLALRSVAIDSPRKLLGGFTWTVESGWSLLAETWWDGTAPTAGDWSTLAQQAARRSSLLGFPGVPAAAVNASIVATACSRRRPAHGAGSSGAWRGPTPRRAAGRDRSICCAPRKTADGWRPPRPRGKPTGCGSMRACAVSAARPSPPTG